MQKQLVSRTGQSLALCYDGAAYVVPAVGQPRDALNTLLHAFDPFQHNNIVPVSDVFVMLWS